MLLDPVVLKILTTLAPEAHWATISPPEVVVPSANPERSAIRGFVQSSRSFPRKSSEGSTLWTAGQGNAFTTTSPNSAACCGVPTRALPPHCSTSVWTSCALGTRTPKQTSCPRSAHFLPSAPPTLPAPRIPSFIC